MEKLNTDAGKSNIWVRTQMNAPAQRPWFTDTGGAAGVRPDGERPRRRQPDEDRRLSLALEGIQPYLDRIANIASEADVLADRIRRPAERSC